MVVLPASPVKPREVKGVRNRALSPMKGHVRQPADGRAKTHAEAIDGEHERLREVDERLKQPGGPVDGRLGFLADFAQIQARGKRPAGASHDGHPNRCVVRRRQQSLGQGIKQHPIEGVERLGPV